MPKLDKASVKWLIKRLDVAYDLARKAPTWPGRDDDLCWNIMQVRDHLISAAIVDVSVEPVPAGELIDMREADPGE